MTTTTATAPTFTSDQALKIAEADAIAKYGDLSRFRIEIRRDQNGWHIGYFIDQRGSRFLTGGGPHYVIDATTGLILEKKYYQ